MRNLILLHGAIGASDQFLYLKDQLTSNFNVHLFDFIGHGQRSNENIDFSIENFASDLNYFIIQNKISKPYIFGYSMGGYVAIYYLLNFKNEVQKVFTLGTKFEWTLGIAYKEIKMLNPDIIEEKIPKFAEQLKKRHGEINWKIVLHQTANMMLEMGNNNPLTIENISKCQIPILFSIGDRDKMVTFDETLNCFKNNSNSSFLVLPKTEHPIEKVNNSILSFHIHQFFA